MSLLKELRPTLPILIGAAIMLSLSGGIRQSFGLIMPPLTRDIAVSVSDFALAMSVQNLAWGFLQPVGGRARGPRRLPAGDAGRQRPLPRWACSCSPVAEACWA
jgi:hypothetical protein